MALLILLSIVLLLIVVIIALLCKLLYKDSDEYHLNDEVLEKCCVENETKNTLDLIKIIERMNNSLPVKDQLKKLALIDSGIIFIYFLEVQEMLAIYTHNKEELMFIANIMESNLQSSIVYLGNGKYIYIMPYEFYKNCSETSISLFTMFFTISEIKMSSNKTRHKSLTTFAQYVNFDEEQTKHLLHLANVLGVPQRLIE